NYIKNLVSPNASPSRKKKAKKASKAYNQLQAQLVIKNQKIASLKAQNKLLSKTKKRRAIPNPSKKFMQIGDIIAQGYTTKDIEEKAILKRPRKRARREPIVVNKDKENNKNEEPKSSDKEPKPIKAHSRVGRAIRKPSRYDD
ncbi:hypothetical protein DHEL01_v201949, partial [Diaporthe helianthi]